MVPRGARYNPHAMACALVEVNRPIGITTGCLRDSIKDAVTKVSEKNIEPFCSIVDQQFEEMSSGEPSTFCS
jgi:hypothetical protein